MVGMKLGLGLETSGPCSLSSRLCASPCVVCRRLFFGPRGSCKVPLLTSVRVAGARHGMDSVSWLIGSARQLFL